MSKLDNLESMMTLDTQNMYQRIHDFPEQLADAQKIGGKWDFDPNEFAGVANITLAGMDGSAIGGDLVRSIVANELQAPFTICRNYRLPEYVDDESLVIVSSYSGNTEETLNALDDAQKRKAMIVCLTTGGKLAEVASAEGYPILKIPGGLQPRAALGYSFVPLLSLFSKLQFIKSADKAVAETITALKDARKKLTRETSIMDNSAKKLAEMFAGRIPLIYSGPELTDTVAVRWRGQFSENSKSLAFSNQFPEMNHNELVGWSEVAEQFADKLAVVLLRDEDDNPRVKFRLDSFRAVAKKLGVPVSDVLSSGTSRVTRAMSLVQIGDFASYYFAIANGVDPTPVDAIENLKKELARV